ncbi:hypothetical protein ACFQY0_04760 [Haloferula chungangensis]|uniref:Uncharacterized protein n=1 Tax=Haloferula chungangensis TaxID=1048331 RepID=A0ABW2L5P8_9BACT
MKYKQFLVPTLVAATLSTLSTRSDAAIVFNMFEQGEDLVVTGVGSLNLGSATPSSTTAPPQGPPTITLSPPAGQISIGDSTGGQVDLYDITITGPSNFGPGPGGAGAPVNSIGTAIFFNRAGELIGVPTGYASGGALDATSTFLVQSVQAIDAAPGTYVWNLSIPQPGGGATTDTVTLNIVPEPSAALLGALGALGSVPLEHWDSSAVVAAPDPAFFRFARFI